MDLFLAVLYIHVVATLGLVAAMAAEAFALTELRRTLMARDSTYRRNPFPATRAMASICLFVLFSSGGYLTDRVGIWRMAWPKVAIGIIVAFGALAGISGRKLSRIRRVSTQRELPNAEIVRQLQSPFLRTSLAIRTGLVLAAVWLMTAKPDFLASLGIVLAFAIISWIWAALIKPGAQAQSPAPARPEFDA
jgi:hypothetical protein